MSHVHIRAHSSRDVSIALKQIEDSRSLTSIDVRIQLYEVRCSVERIKFNGDIRKRQGLLDPVCPDEEVRY